MRNTVTIPSPLLRALSGSALLALAAASADAALVNYYIGVDGRAENSPGQPNPNHNRLTFLYSHGDHYHSKGVYVSDGSGGAVISASNYLPEGSNPPLLLVAGSGVYDGKLVVDNSDPANEFTPITIRTTDDLASYPAGSPEEILHNSSGGRWAGSLAGAHIHLILESITPGLNVGDSSTLNLFASSDELHFDDEFSPIFWTDADAAPGVYTAQFRLVDEEGLFGDSGTFEFRFEVAPVPEPSSALLAGAALAFGLVRRRR